MSDRITCPVHSVVIEGMKDDISKLAEKHESDCAALRARDIELSGLITITDERINSIKNMLNAAVIKILVIVTGGLFAAVIAILWFMLQKITP